MKLTKQKKRDRLRQIEVLIADPDPRISRLVKHVLESFGFKNIHLVKDGAEAIEILKHKPIDLVLTEWPMEPVDGINFVKFVRQDSNLANRDIPIIMLTGRAEAPDVQAARDSGVTEFVVKPFNAKTLSNRIIEVIDHPRSFIVSRGFTGPDRRRRATEGADNKRATPEEMKKNSTRKGNKLIYHHKGEEIIIHNPDRTLKQMIGADLSADKLFDDELLHEAQAVIMNLKQDFLSWVAMDISRLEFLYDQLDRNGSDRAALAEMVGLSLTIKSQAGTFGYDFATLVGKSLYDFTSNIVEATPPYLTIIRKHIDTLYVIFQKEIQGTGPEIGEEVLTGLRMLVDKYTKSA